MIFEINSKNLFYSLILSAAIGTNQKKSIFLLFYVYIMENRQYRSCKNDKPVKNYGTKIFTRCESPIGVCLGAGRQVFCRGIRKLQKRIVIPPQTKSIGHSYGNGELKMNKEDLFTYDFYVSRQNRAYVFMHRIFIGTANDYYAVYDMMKDVFMRLEDYANLSQNAEDPTERDLFFVFDVDLGEKKVHVEKVLELSKVGGYTHKMYEGAVASALYDLMPSRFLEKLNSIQQKESSSAMSAKYYYSQIWPVRPDVYSTSGSPTYPAKFRIEFFVNSDEYLCVPPDKYSFGYNGTMYWQFYTRGELHGYNELPFSCIDGTVQDEKDTAKFTDELHNETKDMLLKYRRIYGRVSQVFETKKETKKERKKTADDDDIKIPKIIQEWNYDNALFKASQYNPGMSTLASFSLILNDTHVSDQDVDHLITELETNIADTLFITNLYRKTETGDDSTEKN